MISLGFSVLCVSVEPGMRGLFGKAQGDPLQIATVQAPRVLGRRAISGTILRGLFEAIPLRLSGRGHLHL